MRTLPPAATAFVAFGSNLEPRLGALSRALRALARVDGIRIEKISPLYATDPLGGPRQGEFYNGVVRLSVRGEPEWLLERLQDIERRLGRTRTVRWGPRVVDLDLLSFGRCRRRSRRLTLPHPRYHRRRFVLAPLCDLAPRRRHSGLGVENRTLLARLPLSAQRVTMVGLWKKSRFRLFSKKRKPASASLR